MSCLHSLLKSLRSDLLEVATFALAVHICLDRSEFLISFFTLFVLISRPNLVTFWAPKSSPGAHQQQRVQNLERKIQKRYVTGARVRAKSIRVSGDSDAEANRG